MKNKKMIYLLGLVVAVVWGLIVYRIFEAAGGSDNHKPVTQTTIKEPFNDFAIEKDTTRLLLNYRDPFGLTASRDTAEQTNKKIIPKIATVASVQPVINWAIIQYAGYISNPKSKRLITLLSINGRSEMLTDGEIKQKVKLIRNMRDSVKVNYNGKTKFIHLKSNAQ